MTNMCVYQLRLHGARNPFYIGMGAESRAHDHMKAVELRKKNHKTHTILKAQREGREVLVEYLSTELTRKQAAELEIAFIRAYGRKHEGGCLVNITEGGEGIVALPPEVCAARGLKHRGKVVSEETRARMRASKLGVKQTAEHIANRTAGQRGRARSPETIEKMRKSATGRVVSEETRRRLSLAGKGRSSGPFTAERRAKLSVAKLKTTSNVARQIMSMLSEGMTQCAVAQQLGLAQSTISNVKRGLFIQAGDE